MAKQEQQRPRERADKQAQANQQKKDNKNTTPSRKMSIFYILLTLVLVALAAGLLLPEQRAGAPKSVSYTEFVKKVNEKQVKQVKLNLATQEIDFATETNGKKESFKTTAFPGDDQITKTLLDQGIDITAELPRDNSGWMQTLLFIIAPIALFALLGWFEWRQLKKMMGDDNPSMNFNNVTSMFGGKSNSKIVAQSDTGVTFKDVAGQDEAKESLQEIVGFLENPAKYEEIGAKLPRGALLVGPPGTGKTLLAKAVAGEAKVPFFSISGSEFVEMFVGRGAAKVRDLFQQATEKAPCIVFIDEIDTIGKRRDASFSNNDEREQTLNQLLTEMDGFDNHKGIVVLGATNRPDSLDPALLRPGRFDRRVPVELPDLAGRNAILNLHSRDVKMEGDIDLDVIARSTPGASGADLANIINEAALRAVRMGRKRVIQEDIEESVEVVIAGEKRKSTVLSEHEKKVVAYHEIGHAIVAAAQKGSAPVSKITIVPRTSGALGYTMQVEEDEHFLVTRTEAVNKLAVFCGGRAAEELIFHEITTGASNDIEQATKLARNMISQYGMSDKFGMVALGQVQNRYLSDTSQLTCSEGTAQVVDQEVIALIRDAHTQAVTILQKNLFKLHELSRYLQKKETITGKEFMNIFTRDDGFAPDLPKVDTKENSNE